MTTARDKFCTRIPVGFFSAPSSPRATSLLFPVAAATGPRFCRGRQSGPLNSPIATPTEAHLANDFKRFIKDAFGLLAVAPLFSRGWGRGLGHLGRFRWRGPVNSRMATPAVAKSANNFGQALPFPSSVLPSCASPWDALPASPLSSRWGAAGSGRRGGSITWRGTPPPGPIRGHVKPVGRPRSHTCARGSV